MQLSASPVRYSLTLTVYPSESLLPEICEVIYQTRDPRLAASLASLPYSVGRTFTPQEVESIRLRLAELGVGFSFKSNIPGYSDIEFDPHLAKKSEGANQAEEEKPPAVVTARSRSWGFILIAMAILIVGIGSFVLKDFFRFQFSQKISVSNPNPKIDFDARLEKIIRRVEFRRNRDLLWSSAEENLSLSNADAIHTFEEAFATLQYREGSSIVIRPNSLVIVGQITPETDRRVQLDEGTVQAKLRYSKTPHKLSIATRVGTLEIQSPSEPNQESRMETEIRGDQLKVRVDTGAAILMPLNPKQAPISVQAQQQIEATPTQIHKPQRYISQIQLDKPADGQSLHIDPAATEPVIFSWQPYPSASEYRWILATDDQAKNILLEQKTASTTVSLNYLDLGKLYWTVTTEIDGKLISSPIYKLNVQKLSQ